MVLANTPSRPGEASHLNIEWEDSPCPLCGHHVTDPTLEGQDPHPAQGPGLIFAVVCCRKCGHHYTNPRPSPASIGQFYPPNYVPHRRSRGAKRRRNPSWWSKLTGRAQPERRGYIPWRGQGRLLDFGCGGGSFLLRMAEQGWNVTGLDMSAEAVARVRQDLELRALHGSLPHPDLKPGSFDVITMWHSIEHVHDPLAIVREAYQLLAPQGLLIIACPNIASVPYRWFGPAWFGLDLPRHLSHFTPETLTELAIAAGFQTQPVRYIRHTDWLASSARLAQRQGRATWLHRSLLWKPIARAVGWAIYMMGQSDCMMIVCERPAYDRAPRPMP